MKIKRTISTMIAAILVALSPVCAWASSPTTAGTLITNEAFGTFRDNTTGTISQLNSNIVTAQVDVLESLQLTSDNTVVRAPGSSFTILHVLTNTGNVATQYSVSLGTVAGATATLQNLVVYWDSNKNGVVDSGDPVIASTFTVNLQPGESTNLIVYGAATADSQNGSSAQVKLSASSADQVAQATNLDTIQVQVGLASLQLTKRADVNSSSPNSDVTFTISATNNGSASASGAAVTVDGAAQTFVLLNDVIPANTSFSSVVLNGGGATLFHRAGDPALQYVTAQPSDKTTIDAVAFGFARLDVGQLINVAFKVTIAANASSGITNIADIYGVSGTNNLHVTSNQITVSLPSVPPALAFFGDGTFTHTTSVTLVGAPLFVQAIAAQCNANPDAAETHPITITSTLTSDKETFSAVETGPNTGIFRVVPDVPTRDSSANPVTIGNGIIETLRGDTLTAVLQGCGSASVQANMLVDPGGVVFDSRTNAPVSNASVTLIDVTGQGNGGHAGQAATVLAPDGVTVASSTVTTSTDGRFTFPLVAASTYKFVVSVPIGFTFPSVLPTSQLPIGHNIDQNGSYARDFVLNGTGSIQIDLPVDRASLGTMMIEKIANKSTAEIGDFVDYTITLKNVSSVSAGNIVLTDKLPLGFTYELGSARVNGSKVQDPQGGRGPALQFALDSIAANASVTITYRVHIGQNARIGKNANSAFATDGITKSNIASAIVDVQGGAFRQEGFIFGKVYMDCNGNRRQDAGEKGVPGVRVVLEDQTYAITDGEGKYSIYGVLAHTHVVKIDRTSMPAGFQAEALSNRNAGDGESVFADVKSGEMFKADFATACSDELSAAVEKRRKLPEYRGNHNDEAVLGMTFNYDSTHKGLAEAKAAQASGILGQSNSSAQTTAASAQGITKLAPTQTENALVATPSKPSAPVVVPLEQAVRGETGTLAFLNLHYDQVMAYTQTDVRVVGPKGSVFKLFVNGQEVSEKRVGKRVSDPEHGFDAWEYIGVELKTGGNKLLLVQFDQFGNERGRTETRVIAPKQLHQVAIEVPKNAAADGKTPVKIAVHLFDADNVPVLVPTEVTLETTDGEWQVKDINRKEPGIQAMVEGGSAEFTLLPPTSPVTAKIRMSTGTVQNETALDFVPELRPMIAVGVVDQTVNFRNISGAGAATSASSFEQALNNFSVSNASGSTNMQSHIAASLKGTVWQSYLLTFAYDSDKDQNERLFRDIQPDDYYPVYGDSSVRGYDAQSTSRMYFRIDHGKNYALFGDFSTQESDPSRYLSIYTRSATGTKEHYQNDHFSVTAFASHDSRTQFVEEIAANGTSGPYMLKNANGVVNSETVEIVVRDRNQPALILFTTQVSRFTDYEFDNTTGQIIFKSPVNSLDQYLNPVSIRVSYEVDEGGAKFWLTGIDTSVRLNSRVKVGGMYVADLNPADEYHLMGFNSTVKLADKTTLTSEFATTSKDSVGEGTGYHFELQRETGTMKLRTYFGRTTENFSNMNALLNSGRGEGGMKMDWKLSPSNRFVIDAIRTEGTTTGGTQVGAQASIEHTLRGGALLEYGVKHVETGSATTGTSTDAAAGTTVTTLRTRFTMTAPYLQKLRVYSEVEQDVESTQKHNISVGGTYQLFDRGKLYLRHELISSLGNTYSLNSQQQQAVTVFGIDTNYMKSAHVVSEYRGNDSFSGRDTEAAIGLRNVWTLRPGLKVNTGIESVKVLGGSNATDNLALTASGEYTANQLWKGTGRVEWRTSSATRSFLNTLGASVRLSPTWTFLGRSLLNFSSSNNSMKNDSDQGRLQLGFAFRDSATSVFNVLAMIELKSLRTETATLSTKNTVSVFSANFNYQPASPLVFTARYATRLTVDNSSGLSSNSNDNLLSGRVTYDITRKWDVGFNSTIGFSRGFGSRQYGFGPEIGRVIAKNLWLSAGYNVFGFADSDLASEKETNRGAFIRFRFKFDERFLIRRSAQ